MTRQLRIFAAWLLLPCSTGWPACPGYTPTPGTGTLVLFIPTKDGLVVAADSRSNVNLGTAIPRHCDTAIKIIPLKNHERAVITVAGTDQSYPLNGAKLPDLCKYLQSAVPILDMPQIVANYLDAKNVEITKGVFGELQAHVLRKLRAVQAKRPDTLVNGADGNFAVVAFGHYIPEQKISQVATFTVRILKRGNAAIVESGWNEYHLSTNWEVRAIGDGAGFLQELIKDQSPGIMAGYLVNYAHYKREFSPVGDVPGDAGAKIAINLMEAAEILSDRLPGPHTVGGPTHIFLLEREHPAPLPVQ
jgi:hypothetical protein